MIDIENLLSSISDEDMAKIKSVADSLMNNNEQKQEKPQPKPVENVEVAPVKANEDEISDEILAVITAAISPAGGCSGSCSTCGGCS